MAKPQEPLSLFKLACVAMRKDAKNGDLKFRLNLHQVSPDVKKCIWNQFSLMEIITFCADMESTDFFSSIIRSKWFEVHSLKFLDKMCMINVSCIGKPNLTWYITSARLPWDTANEWDTTYFDLKVGNAYYPAFMKLCTTGSEIFESNLPYQAQTDIANCLCHLFQKDGR
ncbi:hypothetical protein CAEBREN_01296 [Caenorhabditis brenneri]|uniref:Uncharacterized protein n=1 Tax=Caenorhabditis brenneri TaxID=135651 RepID=G0MAA1_CAEBE|nr:hypothetical protein CAEBREN_01296 [Caenorhabditis brenneri]